MTTIVYARPQRCANDVCTGRPAVVQLQFACVHEHIWKSLSCGECATLAQRGVHTECWYCANSTRPHVCRCEVAVLADKREVS